MKMPESWEAALCEANELTVFQLKGSPTPLYRIEDYAIVRQAEVETGDMQSFSAAVVQGIVEEGRQARCFFPRHALRARRGESVLEMIICFQCGHILATLAGEKMSFPTSGHCGPFFDAYFPKYQAARGVGAD